MKDAREIYEAPKADIEKIETEDVLVISIGDRGELPEIKWEW